MTGDDNFFALYLLIRISQLRTSKSKIIIIVSPNESLPLFLTLLALPIHTNDLYIFP